MSGEKEYEDSEIDDDIDSEDADESIGASSVKIAEVSLESRRKLEDALEERRLQRAIRDYDFFFD